jgi:hypothetical protein
VDEAVEDDDDEEDAAVEDGDEDGDEDDDDDDAVELGCHTRARPTCDKGIRRAQGQCAHQTSLKSSALS